ncbi:hypothetical protein CYMTET_48214 [Cymbomonas tetramitiformis]|uniref:Methyltransferase domain-containing protein n=1 Tax=Cymbomonas tetramitiformis TaxID=36881 RepID=A0AAE0BUG6_9CHLO|nr:hypothetical protein CYMTET_48214 [Cymbomonas tetramitiformis]
MRRNCMHGDFIVAGLALLVALHLSNQEHSRVQKCRAHLPTSERGPADVDVPAYTVIDDCSSQAPPLAKFPDDAEVKYQESIKKREEKLKDLQSEAKPELWNRDGGVYLWDYFTPAYNCPNRERIGRLGDGGKWICDLPRLMQDGACTVFSFGARDDVSFELELASSTKCQIEVHDPTVGGLSSNAVDNPQLRFHKKAIAADRTTSPFLVSGSLGDAMALLGVSFIDVLKVDVEGSEWEVFESLLADPSKDFPVGQLLIELHLDDGMELRQVVDFFSRLEQRGFRIFMNEVNLAPTFTHRKPIAIEYSLIHPMQWRNRAVLRSVVAGSIQPAPQVPKVSACIYFLTHSSRQDQMTQILKELYAHFTKTYPYPVVVFHDDFSEAQISALRAAVPLQELYFETVQFAPPSWLDPKSIPERTKCPPDFLGYRFMCRFHSQEVHQRLGTKYEYHWRLDDDSRIRSQVSYDIFEMMRFHGKKYGFVNAVFDNPPCVENLWPLTREFLEQNQIQPTFFHEYPEGWVFYNNFEVSHRSIWSSDTYKRFMGAVDAANGIFLNRWGDAAIKSIGVSLVVDPAEVHRFDDFPYYHAPFADQASSGLPDRRWTLLDWDMMNRSAGPAETGGDLKRAMKRPRESKGWQLKRVGLTSMSSLPVLPPDVHARCTAQGHTAGFNFTAVAHLEQPGHANEPAAQLFIEPHRRLMAALQVRSHGYLGSEVAASVALPRVPGGVRKQLVILRNQQYGLYDHGTCSRQVAQTIASSMAVLSPTETGSPQDAYQAFFYYAAAALDGRVTELFEATSPAAKASSAPGKPKMLTVHDGVTADGRVHLLARVHGDPRARLLEIRNPTAEPYTWDYEMSLIPPMQGGARGVRWGTAIFTRASREPQSQYIYLAGEVPVHEEEGGRQHVVLSRLTAGDMKAGKWTNRQYLVDTKLMDSSSAAQHRELRAMKWLREVPAGSALANLFTTDTSKVSFTYSIGLRQWVATSLNAANQNTIMMHSTARLEDGLPWVSKPLLKMLAPFRDSSKWRCSAPTWHSNLQESSELVFSFGCEPLKWAWRNSPAMHVPFFMKVMRVKQ